MSPFVQTRSSRRAALCCVAMLLLASASYAADTGSLAGQVYDRETGKGIAGATVVATGAGAPETRTTGADGTFAFDALLAGSYALRFSAPTHREATAANVAVQAGAKQRADQSLEPLPKQEPAAATPAAGAAGATGGASKAPPVADIEEFVVTGSSIAMDSLELRITSDELLNVLSAEELSKFAASDVADAAKRVAGVNVVEGQFAVIRGLEDRYSSTTYNTAPVPSPDPDRQSVQLDLFPADVVQNLSVAKTFAPDLPSNSAGGSIDIMTLAYPEQLEIKVSAGTGASSYAWDHFLRFDEGSPIGHENGGGWDVLENDFSGSIGGPFELFDREFRFKAVAASELDFYTAEGVKQSFEPATVRRLSNGTVTNTGDLSLGELGLSGGEFDFLGSDRTQQKTGYGSFGFDVDPDGNHRIDFSTFYTKKDNEVVEQYENGWFPNVDYGRLVQAELDGNGYDRSVVGPFVTRGAWIDNARETRDDAPERGPLWYSSFFESRSFKSERDLQIYQLNGDHTVAQVEGLTLKWATNWAKTTQNQSARGLRYFYEPDDLTLLPTSFPVQVDSLGTGIYAANSGFTYSETEVEEKQRFGRLDAEYEIPATLPLVDEVIFKLSAGGWYEKADRDVTSAFLGGTPRSPGTSLVYVTGDEPESLGQNAFQDVLLDERGRPSPIRDTESQATRKIKALDAGAKATFWDRFDVLGGVRREKIEIESNNDPFTGELTSQTEGPRGPGAPAIFPSAYLMFDRLDNTRYSEGSARPGLTFNDQILGIDVPLDPTTGFVDLRTREEIEALVNGLIDETKYLPSAAVAYRPLEGLSLRGAFSQTVARPSLRELGYYPTVEPGNDDVTIGNPQLQLSDVTSWDARIEYTWGDLGDLAAVSLFLKDIERPIESIVLRDALNAEADNSGLFRTFFNNPNEAKLKGVEAEVRKNLGFLGHEFLEYFSIGGNFTYIDAEVERTEAELSRASRLFGAPPGAPIKVQKYEKKRRLYNQPEWIANADVTFDQPDWGTKITLSFFGISSVLDAAGVASVNTLGEPLSFTLDRYVDGFYTLDLVASQRIWWDGLVLKVSVKNLTNSTREIIYDQEQTVNQVAERSYKVGRDYSISLSYTYEF